MNIRKPIPQLLVLTILSLTLGWVLSMKVLAEDAPKGEWKAPARAAKRKNPIPADEKSLASGKASYVQNCLQCHGPTGKGDGPAAKDLDPKPKDLSDVSITAQTDGALFWKITTGKKPMPAFEKLISEDDRWNVINYIRTLAASPTSGKDDGGKTKEGDGK